MATKKRTNEPTKSRRSYSAEFKAEAAKLVLEQGMTQADAARDLGVAPSLIGRWVERAREAARPGALSEEERQELKRLRKENKVLRTEREILKKAAAFFAKESR
jgi:transposase